MKNGVRNITIFGTFIFIIIINLILYFILKLFNISLYHELFLLGVIIILNTAILIFSIEGKSRILLMGSILIIVIFGIDFLTKLFLKEMTYYLLLDNTIHIIASIGLGISLLGTYFQINKILRQKNINLVSYEQSETLYLEYFYWENKVNIEFSELFTKKYGIVSKSLLIDIDTFKSYIHPEDYEESQPFLKSQNKFRLKFPGMDDYAHILFKGKYDLDEEMVYIGFDITEYETIQQKINKKTKEYELLEKEKEMIVESAEDYVAKFKRDGTIVYASVSYSKIFSLDEKTIIGKNIFDLNKERDINDNEWFYETISNHTNNNQAQDIIDGKNIWLSWQNNVFLGEDGEVEYIITVGRDVTDLVELNKSLKLQTLQDYVTGIYNNVGLFTAMRELKDIKNAHCFFFDIYHFSSMVNYYGNEIGSLLLKLVADKLVKLSDNHLVARYSADQFVILYINITPEEEMKYREKLANSINLLYEKEETSIQFQLKIGYAKYPDDTNDLFQIFTLSNLAMNEIYDNSAKYLQKYEPYMYERFSKNISMSIKLKEAINNNLIDIYFQKIINVENNSTTFVEALARWNDKDMGFISPEYFIEIARLSGLIDILEEYLFNKTIDAYINVKKLPKYENTKLTINITPSTLNKDDISRIFEKIITSKGLKPSDICIEISEKTFVRNADKCIKNIKEFKNRGFIIALDDFGREYSSLSLLDNIDFDIIKIDGTFVSNIAKPQNKAIINMIMTISEIANKQIIAECVETDVESNALKEMNCFMQQGYYFHVPEKYLN